MSGIIQYLQLTTSTPDINDLPQLPKDGILKLSQHIETVQKHVTDLESEAGRYKKYRTEKVTNPNVKPVDEVHRLPDDIGSGWMKMEELCNLLYTLQIFKEQEMCTR